MCSEDSWLKASQIQQCRRSLVVHLFSVLCCLGIFFYPSDAFPPWEFESDILLSGLRSSGQNCIDWFQTDQDYVGLNSRVSSRLWVESRCREAEAYEETATKEEDDR
ncbi:hypothetical protein FF1_028221 [Malus domestica]